MTVRSKGRYLIIILYILFIFYHSLANGESSGSLSAAIASFLIRLPAFFGWHVSFEAFHHFIRKAAHFSEYAVLAMIVLWSVKHEKNHQLKLFLPLLCGICTAVTDEMIQHFVPGRYGCLPDVLLDLCGYFLVYCLVRLAKHPPVS